jgi:hypothetical protein
LQHQQRAAIQKTVDDHTYRIHYQERVTMGDGLEQNGAMGMSSMLKEVQELADKFKVEEDEQYISPYAHLEKATVLQEARYVHPQQLRIADVIDENGLVVIVCGMRLGMSAMI